MKKVFIFLLSIFYSQFIFSQEKMNFDFIITVDEKILLTLSNPKIIVRNKNNEKIDDVRVNYYPGNFSVDTEKYNELLSEADTQFYLNFQQYEYSKKGIQNIKNYEIELGKSWFKEQYIILNIYNTDTKKYRKLTPLSIDKSYTFDIATSNGQMIRVKN